MDQIEDDWLDREGGRLARVPESYVWQGVAADRETEFATASAAFPLIDIGMWADRDPPEREWLLSDFMPLRQATYLTGPGSAGKSLLGQQLATCVAAGRPLLGVAARCGPAIYITAEDDADELERRHRAIMRSLGLRATDIDNLGLVSLCGRLDNELMRVVDGRCDVTEKFYALEQLAAGQSLIVLDNVAHFFAGNENVRHDVASFVGALNRVARNAGGAVLLIGHPNKAGDSFSGSTAWENQVRSRLYMEMPADSADRDVRVLSRQKSNYARNGETIEFRWHEWAFVRDEDIPANLMREISATAVATGDNQIFLECLRERVRQGEGRHVGPTPGPNYAPSQFEGMPQAKGLKRGRLKVAMDRLFALNAIEVSSFRHPKGRNVSIIREAIPVPRTAFPNPSRTVPEVDPEPAPNGARTTPHTLPYINISGAAHEAAPPDSRDTGTATDWADAKPEHPDTVNFD